MVGQLCAHAADVHVLRVTEGTQQYLRVLLLRAVRPSGRCSLLLGNVEAIDGMDCTAFAPFIALRCLQGICKLHCKNRSQESISLCGTSQQTVYPTSEWMDGVNQWNGLPKARLCIATPSPKCATNACLPADYEMIEKDGLLMRKPAPDHFAPSDYTQRAPQAASMGQRQQGGHSTPHQQHALPDDAQPGPSSKAHLPDLAGLSLLEQQQQALQLEIQQRLQNRPGPNRFDTAAALNAVRARRAETTGDADADLVQCCAAVFDSVLGQLAAGDGGAPDPTLNGLVLEMQHVVATSLREGSVQVSSRHSATAGRAWRATLPPLDSQKEALRESISHLQAELGTLDTLAASLSTSNAVLEEGAAAQAREQAVGDEVPASGGLAMAADVQEVSCPCRTASH